MSKLNRGGAPTATRSASARATSPMTAVSATPDTTTHEGGPGFTRNARTELFVACAASFVAEDSFYEKGTDRVARVRDLVHTVAAEDGGLPWLLDFVTWLRGEGNIRTAAVIVAAEAVRARVAAKLDTSGVGSTLPRQIVAAACQRADEPGELLGYWTSNYGRPVPNAIKRGLADAANRLYTEYSTLKYDTDKADVRFGDVVSLCRPAPGDKYALFRHLIERRHPNWTGVEPTTLPMIQARANLNAIPVADRRALLANPAHLAALMRNAGATWEWLSGWLADGQGMDAVAWKAALPQMGYMARLRNLRNLDQAGVDDETADVVATMLADADQVAKSRQLPFRFLSAYRNAPSDRWRHPLGRALNNCLRNIPELPGSTLVMVDTSLSMTDKLSDKSSVSYVEAGALFGVALANRNMGNADLYGFADSEFAHAVTLGGSVLRDVELFVNRVGETGHGTAIEQSTAHAFVRKPGGYDRVVIISDMQSFGSGHYSSHADRFASSVIPAHVPVYAFDLSGYKAAVMAVGSGNRFQLGGLSDSTFRLIPLLEQGRATGWPWEHEA